MKLILTLFICASVLNVNAQSKKDSIELKKSNSVFKDYYPISVKPTLGYISSMNGYEEILFDAKPIVYYSFYNNMQKVMQDSIDKRLSKAFYVNFQPHIRMYNEESKPVKTPSYKVLLGGQFLYKTDNNNFISFAIESGHYSNGQSGCAFDSDLNDETDECDDIYRLITPQTDLSAILNRTSGNFSTNLTKLFLNYRFNNLNGDSKPVKIHSFTTSWELYHNNMFGLVDLGGYSDFDIEIYGRNRFGLEYEFIHTPTEKINFRYSLGQKFEMIQGAHNYVEPLRSETTIIIYPWDRDIGFFASYIYGHDNYNYRFVDSGNQLYFGVTWDWFTPFEINRAVN
ncbi:MAG: hypothetical protein IMY67_06175 [Bacteroidetes bacterium]|nr:hypothetical protein [Bacteroidota bacterium]